jgi:hypothetical protein
LQEVGIKLLDVTIRVVNVIGIDFILIGFLVGFDWFPAAKIEKRKKGDINKYSRERKIWLMAVGSYCMQYIEDFERGHFVELTIQIGIQ